MFTGIVEKLGTVISTSHLKGKTYSMRIDLGRMNKTARIGDSIAINGVCLTVTGKRGTVASFDVISETLKRTDLGTLVPGSRVNIERSMTLKDRISGHFVSGHIDGTGKISRVTAQKDGSIKMVITLTRKLTSMMVEKGSVALDGISLTLVDVTDQQISVCLIPHTLKITTLGFKKESDLVNIEADLVGKYVLKLASNYRNQFKS
jgi:riboflavin synthase